MIVITKVSNRRFTVLKGDSFSLTLSDGKSSEVIIKETISKGMLIDFVATYRFTKEDGTCEGNHLSGIFANSDDLPEMIMNAVMMSDLEEPKRTNFKNSFNALV